MTDLAGRINTSTVEDLKRLNKIIKNVKSDHVSLKFQNLGKNLEIHIFTDASFGNLRDSGSQRGHFIITKGNNQKMNPISWQSHKIKRIVKSMLARETLTLSEGKDDAFSISMLLSELLNNHHQKTIPLKCFVDHSNLVEAIKSTKLVVDKKLRIEIASIKEILDKGEICLVTWLKSNDQIANCLSKRDALTYNMIDCLNNGEMIEK